MSYRLPTRDPDDLTQRGPYTHVIRESDGACIPVKPENQDFQEFLKWNEQQQTPINLEGE